MAREKKAERIKESKSMMLDLLSSSGCVDCGTDNILVLEFDHRDREEKEYTVSYMVCQGYKWSKILDEIRKCDIVCANCHRIRTHRDNNSYRVIEPTRKDTV